MQAIPLPAPRTHGDLSLEAAIAGRRSVRAFTDQALTRAQLSQLLWAAQNLLLKAVALGLGGAPIGAFYDDPLQTALALPKDHAPLYLLVVGYPDE